MPAALIGPLLLAVAGAFASVLLGVWLAQLQRARLARKLKEQRDTDSGGRWLDHGALGDGKGGLDPELLQQIKRIHLRTGHMVTDLMAGEYQSIFKGRGMEFEEVREYFPGDDVRSIDWNVTARMQRPFVKEFREERELNVMLLVDVSRSGDFGTAGQLKNELAAELAATLAFAATRNNDKVGLMLFTDRVERFLPPKKGRGHVWRLIREILHCERQGNGTDLSEALSYLGRVVRRKAVVFLISDFLWEDDVQRALQQTNKRHDLVVFQVTDPREEELPDVGFLALEDAEDGGQAWLDTSSRRVRQSYAKEAKVRALRLQTDLRRWGVDLVRVSTRDGVTEPLLRYFRQREKGIRR